MRTMIITALCLALTDPALADEEDFLGYSEIRIVSHGTDLTGKVTFDAVKDGDRFERVTIEAFGKTYSLDDGALARLEGMPLHDLRATTSPGYPQVGGPGVYFRLKRMFYDKEQRLTVQRVTIAVNRGRGLSVGQPERELVKTPGGT